MGEAARAKSAEGRRVARPAPHGFALAGALLAILVTGTAVTAGSHHAGVLFGPSAETRRLEHGMAEACVLAALLADSAAAANVENDRSNGPRGEVEHTCREQL
jgi:hypothetical protein